MPTGVTLTEDEDLIGLEPMLERHCPRTDSRTGSTIRSWDTFHKRAAEEIERRLRSSRSVGSPAKLGNLGGRSRAHLKECAAHFALHFLYIANDAQGDGTGFFPRKATYHFQRANTLWEAESGALDYGSDESGTLDSSERQRPFVARIVRG